jgi:hypothetical protein
MVNAKWFARRFDASYDDSNSGGYRDLSLSVEVGWTIEEAVVSFEKVQDWGRLKCQRHICEIQGTPCLISRACTPEATACRDTARVACLLVSGAGVSCI